jgi:hypothetical protein
VEGERGGGGWRMNERQVREVRMGRGEAALRRG